MHLCLFEDSHAKNFLPLVHFRPVYDLRCGMLTFRERAIRCLSPSSVTIHSRQYLTTLLREENPGIAVNSITADSCLFVNGRSIVSPQFARTLKKTRGDCVFVCDEEVVAAVLSGNNLNRMKTQMNMDLLDLTEFLDLPSVTIEAQLVRYPWDVVYANVAELTNDFKLLTGKGVWRKGEVHRSAVLQSKKSISIGKRARIDPYVVLDATHGPIFIGDDVQISATAVIEGPCSIGGGSVVRIGARIHGNTSIGPLCKVGGEIEHSILHSHSNKQHDGFLGHSYIGQWVNLGAGTTTSNLKNTYGTVKVRINGSMVDSGKTFFGMIAGDHSKMGINMSLSAGTIVGTSSNLYGANLPPKEIPAFSWGDSEGLMEYDIEKATAVAEKVMARRQVQASGAYRGVFRNVFLMTAHERAKYQRT